jgi:hypothetical protein
MHAIFSRNENAVTVNCTNSRNPYQFVLRLYERVDLVLGGFDIPCCAAVNKSKKQKQNFFFFLCLLGFLSNARFGDDSFGRLLALNRN